LLNIFFRNPFFYVIADEAACLGACRGVVFDEAWWLERRQAAIPSNLAYKNRSPRGSRRAVLFSLLLAIGLNQSE